jgi:hypothetical protein
VTGDFSPANLITCLDEFTSSAEPR